MRKVFRCKLFTFLQFPLQLRPPEQTDNVTGIDSMLTMTAGSTGNNYTTTNLLSLRINVNGSPKASPLKM